jgi:RND family efflux transporter MFP subunit
LSASRERTGSRALFRISQEHERMERIGSAGGRPHGPHLRLRWAARAAGILVALALTGALAGLAAVAPHAARAADLGPDTPVPAAPPQPAPAGTATAELVTVPDVYEAVGTVRPRTETRVEAQISGKILSVHVRPGDRFSKGDVLLTLDDRELDARREQAGQALAAARSARDQAAQQINAARAAVDRAEAQYKRIKTLFADRAVTKSELDTAEADYLAAEAGLRQARDGLTRAEADVRAAAKRNEETDIAQGYAKVRALADGQVISRSAEPGDQAIPGKTLLVVRTGGGLRIEALVREGLIGRVRPGERLNVSIPALEAVVPGVVEEVVPNADPTTRTFVVKAALPDVPGLYPGMFGRLLVPMGARKVVLVPRAAVRRVGQLATVRVRSGERWEAVYVTTGRVLDHGVEILSGLAGGETVAIDHPLASAPSARPAPATAGGDADGR